MRHFLIYWQEEAGLGLRSLISELSSHIAMGYILHPLGLERLGGKKGTTGEVTLELGHMYLNAANTAEYNPGRGWE